MLNSKYQYAFYGWNFHDVGEQRWAAYGWHCLEWFHTPDKYQAKTGGCSGCEITICCKWFHNKVMTMNDLWALWKWNHSSIPFSNPWVNQGKTCFHPFRGNYIVKHSSIRPADYLSELVKRDFKFMNPVCVFVICIFLSSKIRFMSRLLG